MLELLQSVTTTLLLFNWRTVRRGRRDLRRYGVQAHPADVQILFKAVELEQVGEFEGTDMASCGSDFLLEIAHHLPKVPAGKAGAQELKPEAFPVKAEGESLAGELAIELMKLPDLCGAIG